MLCSDLDSTTSVRNLTYRAMFSGIQGLQALQLVVCLVYHPNQRQAQAYLERQPSLQRARTPAEAYSERQLSLQRARTPAEAYSERQLSLQRARTPAEAYSERQLSLQRARTPAEAYSERQLSLQRALTPAEAYLEHLSKLIDTCLGKHNIILTRRLSEPTIDNLVTTLTLSKLLYYLNKIRQRLSQSIRLCCRQAVPVKTSTSKWETALRKTPGSTTWSSLNRI